jgi:hypothetical protein
MLLCDGCAHLFSVVEASGVNWFALDVCTPKLVKGVKEIIGEHVDVMNAAMKEWTQIM